MDIRSYSKKILKFLGFSLFLSFTFFEINKENQQIKAEKNLIAATEEDLFQRQQLNFFRL